MIDTDKLAEKIQSGIGFTKGTSPTERSEYLEEFELWGNNQRNERIFLCCGIAMAPSLTALEDHDTR